MKNTRGRRTTATPTPEGDPAIVQDPAAMATPTNSSVPTGMDEDTNMEEITHDHLSVESLNLDDNNQHPTTITSDVINNTSTPLNNTLVPKDDDNDNDKNEKIKAAYRKKIEDLHQLALTCDFEKIPEVNKAIKQYRDMLLEMDNSNNNTKIKDTTNIKNNNDPPNKMYINEKDLPVFQLIEDPPTTKNDTKASYETPESFINAFEEAINMNNLDVNNCWRNYLPKAFINSKNNIYVRWYQSQKFPENKNITWNEVRDLITNRFGYAGTTSNKVDYLLQLRQGRSDKIRDYFDKYREAYNRINLRIIDEEFQVGHFISTLLPKTKTEVKKSLKSNYEGRNTHKSYYPASLNELNEFLGNHVGDIQERLYLSSVDSSNNNEESNNTIDSNKRGGNDNNNDTYKKQKFNNNNNDNNVQSGNNNRICRFCKTQPFSIKHLNNCFEYLKSDEYKKYIRNNMSNEGNNHPLIYKVQLDKKIDTSKIIDRFQEETLKDLEDAFQECYIRKNFSNIKYHNHFNKKLVENNVMVFTCKAHPTDELKDIASPYCPLITVNGEKLIGFLDTGAEISLLNKSYEFADQSIFENIKPVEGSLTFIDKNTSVKRIGKTRPLEIKYRGKPIFEHSFEIADMSERNLSILIGRDLIHKLGIYIENIAYNFDEQEEIIYADTVDENTYVANVTKACSETEYEIFMDKMKPYLKANSEINIHNLCPLPEAKVYLNTPPNKTVYIRQYPVAYSLQNVVREQIEKWLKDKTIEVAQPSGFNNPLTLVPKPNDKEGNKKWRVCLDTRGINNLLENVSNINTPLIEDIFYALRESKVYSVFDISGAFHRLEINKEDRHKLTFTFEGKSWQFRGACFGLKSLSGIFQNLMETIFAEMKDFTCIYIDDLVCHSKDMETHEKHCKMVIEALTKYNLPINQEKTHLARNAVTLLGFTISQEGKSIDPKRLTNIDDWPKPKTAKEMMKFCGWVSYMRGHIPLASELTAPLDHLRYSTKKILEWTPKMDEHYKSIIEIIKKNIVLSHPDLNHPFSLAVDASQYSVGACLFQEFTDKESNTKTIKYIGFMSKALSKSQRSYSVTKKELYALTFGLTKFYKFLYGNKPFNCYTDHRSLSYLFTTKHISMMMLRYMEVILSFPNMNIIWIPGVLNKSSDSLSRLFPTNQDKIIFEKEEKKLFPEMFKQKHSSHKQKKKTTSSKSKKNKLPNQMEFADANHINIERIPNFKTYFCTTSSETPEIKNTESSTINLVRIKTWSIKTLNETLDDQVIDFADEPENYTINFVQKMDESYIIPPEEKRKQILLDAHEFGHFGAEAIIQKIRKDQGLNWPNMIKDALEIVKQCSICQKFVIAKRGYNPLKPLYCYTPGWHYQMDLCGPFPVTPDGYTYILVLLDVATRFLIIRPLKDKTAKVVAKELVSIFSLIGYPRILNSDRGGEWRNELLDDLCEAMSIDKRLSTAYYSQGNGGAERAVGNTKKLLSKLILGNSEDDWSLSLNSVQLMINCKIHKRINTSPFNLMFARKMCNEYPLFNDPKDDIPPMDNDELLKRIEYMSDVVFPAIKERTEAYNKMLKDQFDSKHRLINFPVGTFVVVRKKGIQKSLTPSYEGPFEVVRKTKNGNYTLRDEMGLLLPREHTPSELKGVSTDSVISTEDIYEFDAIVDHRGPPGKREYKVRWKNYTAKDDSWIPATNFTNPQSVVNYWKRIKGNVPKEDADQLKHAIPDESNLPAFDKTKKGKLLKEIEQVTEEVEDTSHSTHTPSTRNGKRKQFKKTSFRTKPVKNNPLQVQFRRSTRNHPHNITPKIDITRYKK